MLRIVKHIVTVTLCLLITGGAVGVRFYVSACTHSGDVQLAMEKIPRSCCSHDSDSDASGEPHKDGYFVAHEEGCCKTSSLSISVSHFEVSQASKLSADLPFVTIPNLSHFACAGIGGHTTAVACAPRVADVAPTPIIYLHGQLRL
ncbi:MAG: hypothetical protein LBB79_03480 [Prevotellaceae bacterium]|jgi:hypothetical protein|nr:hypothetical protein [Prevotellaceae bacterium]